MIKFWSYKREYLKYKKIIKKIDISLNNGQIFSGKKYKNLKDNLLRNIKHVMV